jgi:hypothetical protein
MDGKREKRMEQWEEREEKGEEGERRKQENTEGDGSKERRKGVKDSLTVGEEIQVRGKVWVGTIRMKGGWELTSWRGKDTEVDKDRKEEGDYDSFKRGGGGENISNVWLETIRMWMKG